MKNTYTKPTTHRKKKKMNNTDDTAILSEIFELLHSEQDESKAKLFGINKTLAYDYKNIADHGDIYQLIDNAVEDKIGSFYDYLGLITYGWAAPIDKETSEPNGPPSEHPERRRVRLLIVTSKEKAGIVGTALLFVNDNEEPVFDFNEASGPLNEAISKIYE